MEADAQYSPPYQNQGPLMATASMLGLVSFILLVVAIVAGIYIGYRLHMCKIKRDKKITKYTIRCSILSIYKL